MPASARLAHVADSCVIWYQFIQYAPLVPWDDRHTIRDFQQYSAASEAVRERLRVEALRRERWGWKLVVGCGGLLDSFIRMGSALSTSRPIGSMAGSLIRVFWRAAFRKKKSR
ncbi:MAG: hypothetical protein ABI718_04825 [Acidobacteriota bacterium]